LKVISRIQDSGAYLAWEDFKEDAIVDVKPYTPANMHPVYTINQFTVGTDTTGFVLDKSGTTPSLVYTHKPGTEYPVTCLVAPETNLEWRDYTDSGMIVKPAATVFDTVGFGILFYYNSSGSTYWLKNNHDSLFVEGGGISKTYIPGISFAHGDSLYFKISVENADINNVPDQKTFVKIELKKNSQPNFVIYFSQYDETAQHLTGGYSGVYIDLSNVNNYESRIIAPVVVNKFYIKK
jgi:hypothetical protein